MYADNRNIFTSGLGLEIPLIQGPFGGGLSTVELTSAVSERGGLGSFGAHHLDGEAIERIAAEIRQKTDRSFGLNLWIGDHDTGGDDMSEAAFERAWTFYAPFFDEFGLDRPVLPKFYHPRFRDQIDSLIAARPAVFSFVFGIAPFAIIEECRRLGIMTIGAATTVVEIDALEAANVDVILVSGFEAGGHRPSFIERAEDSLMGTLPLTRLAVQRTNRPIIAAGGIIDAAGIRAVLAAGATAAQLGTAFIACQESGTADVHRDILFSNRSEKTVLTRAYTGRLARGIPNRIIGEFDRHFAKLPPFPIHSWFVSKLKAAAIANNIEDFISLYAGQAAPLLKHRTVHALMTEICAEL